MIRVLLLDDHPVVREGLETILSADEGIEVATSVSTAGEAESAVKRREPDVMVADVQLADGDGIELCELLRAQHPRVRTVILTRFTKEEVMERAFAAGARAFVVKECRPEVLRFGVHAVADGGVFIDPGLAGKVTARLIKGRRSRGPSGLTQRQMRVLELLAKGMTNRQIGGELDLGDETVKTHVSMIFDKLGVGDRTEAARFARQEGLV